MHGREKGYTIRAAQPADVEKIASMYGGWLEQATPMAVGQELRTETEWQQYFAPMLRRDDMAIFVADTPSGIAGFLVCRAGQTGRADFIHRVGLAVRSILQRRTVRIAKPRTVGVIDHLYIDPELRNAVLAYDLMNAAFAWFKSRGLTAVEGVVWALNENTLRMAKFLGFKPVRVMLRKELE